MAKTKKNQVSLELDRFEKKITQYQDYLDKFNIYLIEDAAERHKEITAQNSIMDKLPNWLEGLKKLREDSDKKEIQTYGGSEMNEAWKIKKGMNNE